MVKKIILGAIFMIFALNIFAQKLGKNLVDNGDFEKGNFAFFSDFNFVNCREGKNKCGNGAYICTGDYAVGKTPFACNPDWGNSLKDHTSKGGNMMIADFFADKTARIWWQKITVKPYTRYVFSAWVANLAPLDPVSAIRLATDTKSSEVFYLPSNSAWKVYSFSFETKAETQIYIALQTLNKGVMGYDLAIDDICLQEVFTTNNPSLSTKTENKPLEIPGKNATQNDKKTGAKSAETKKIAKKTVNGNPKSSKIIITDTTTKIVTHNINWDQASAVLKPETLPILDELYEELSKPRSKQKQCKLMVVSHTDCRGPEEANLKLSLTRSQNVVEYLIKKGIDPNRLTYKGMGETQPIVSCPIPTDCTEEQHQQNRRTEFIVSW